MANPPRKQHYVPQFYLRGFSTDRKSLYQVVKKSSEVIAGRIKKIAMINDFHNLDGEDVDDPYLLEKQLAQLETHQSACLRDVLAGGIRNKGQRSELIQFLSVMRMRVPAVRAYIDRSYEATIRATSKAMERAGKLSKIRLDDGTFFGVDDLEISVMNWKVMDQMFRMAANEDILKILYGMRVVLYSAPFGTAFVTSDQPVSLYHAAVATHTYGVGPATAGVEICLPLSSRMLLKLDHERGDDLEYVATTEEVLEFNRRTVITAENYVFAGETTDKVAKLVAEFAHLSAGFTHDDLEAGNEYMQVQRYLPVRPSGDRLTDA
jgi:hypothetical protein